jgi:hypothetical protein
MTKDMKIAVSKRAVVARLKRTLGEQGRKLHVARRAWRNTYAVVDPAKDKIVTANVDLETLARECGVLRTWEIISDEVRTYPPTVEIAPVKRETAAKKTKKVVRG